MHLSSSRLYVPKENKFLSTGREFVEVERIGIKSIFAIEFHF